MPRTVFLYVYIYTNLTRLVHTMVGWVTWIVETDDVPREAVVHDLAVLREHLLRARQGERLACPQHLHLYVMLCTCVCIRRTLSTATTVVCGAFCNTLTTNALLLPYTEQTG